MKEDLDKAMEKGANQTKAVTTKGNPRNKTYTTDNTLQTRESEHQEEGGAIMPVRADKKTPPSVDTMASLATTR